MGFETWTIYVLTVLALMSTPGPSQLLILSNSAVHGFSRSLATIAGDLTANILQMIAAGFGLAAIMTTSGNTLYVIKWLGAAYLIWLGIRMIRRASPQNAKRLENAPRASLKTLWVQGFITSASNPKAIVFFAALFPQFIQPQNPFGIQFLILSVTYIVMDGLFLSTYGIGSSWIAAKFKGSAKVWIERVGGAFMIFAALLLGLKTLSDR